MPHHIELIPKILFRSPNPAPFRTIVIGNFQGRYLAPLLELALADCACDYLSCDQIASADHHAAIDRHLGEAREDYQLVLAHPLGADWNAIAKDALIARFGLDRTVFLLNLHFYGAFPDVTTLGNPRNLIFGPMGACHSRIVLGGWMAGLNVDDIVGMFSQESIERLGYPTLFAESENNLRTYEGRCDTKFTDNLLNLAKSSFCFYGFNRPTPNLFINFVAHIGNLLRSTRNIKLNQLPLNAMLAPETLASEGIWPVYPELRSLFTPHFPVGTSFILADRGAGAEVISREIFVRRSMALYDSIGRDTIGTMPQAQNSRLLIKQNLPG
jgi:hypothetical protein